MNYDNLNGYDFDENSYRYRKYAIDNLIYQFKIKFFQIYLIGICNKLIEKYSPNETKRFKKIDKRELEIYV